MNQDAIAIIEADGLLCKLLPMGASGLYGTEQLALSTEFVSFAINHGVEGEILHSIRAEAEKKYSTTAERTTLVLQALNILLKQRNMDPYKKGIVEKAKANLEAPETSVDGPTR